MSTDPVHTDYFPPRVLLVRQTIPIDVTASKLSRLSRSLEFEAEAAITEGKEDYADFRTELRRVMHTRLVALERTAIEAIEAGHRQFATAVLTAAFDTDEARKLLAALPTAEQLMPRLNYNSIKRSLLEGPEAAVLRAGLSITDESDDGREDVS